MKGIAVVSYSVWIYFVAFTNIGRIKLL